ncbi:hypothetical protein FN846DRAFT_994336 [Sphaerosporella brunnea]|uniref:Uncharacterized protein n=1 Tax=Sphaerosporella brunnea TaxID=1250544 RepID=A0A5J5EKH0_9PEZI|nr:hypothetical protein FN846DRAFT_994336 [Sphaerosporella brunnea]
MRTPRKLSFDSTSTSSDFELSLTSPEITASPPPLNPEWKPEAVDTEMVEFVHMRRRAQKRMSLYLPSGTASYDMLTIGAHKVLAAGTSDSGKDDFSDFLGVGLDSIEIEEVWTEEMVELWGDIVQAEGNAAEKEAINAAIAEFQGAKIKDQVVGKVAPRETRTGLAPKRKRGRPPKKTQACDRVPKNRHSITTAQQSDHKGKRGVECLRGFIPTSTYPSCENPLLENHEGKAGDAQDDSLERLTGTEYLKLEGTGDPQRRQRVTHHSDPNPKPAVRTAEEEIQEIVSRARSACDSSRRRRKPGARVPSLDKWDKYVPSGPSAPPRSGRRSVKLGSLGMTLEQQMQEIAAQAEREAKMLGVAVKK